MACVYSAEYDLFQIELSTNYELAEWRDDIKKVMLTAGVENSSSSATRRYKYCLDKYT